MAATTVALSGCAGGHTESESSPAPVRPQPAVVTVSVADGAIDVDPVAPVQVRVAKGTLISLSMVNGVGKLVDGVVAPDRSLWTSAEPLGYGKTYTVTVTSRGATGTTATQTSTFTTVQPRNQTKVYLLTTGGHSLHDEGSYGVGTVVVAHFDEPVADRVAAERHLSVTTSPPVTGSW